MSLNRAPIDADLSGTQWVWYSIAPGQTGTAVLNADDPLVLKMAGYSEAKNICYVTVNPHHKLVREHIRAGGRACAPSTPRSGTASWRRRSSGA